MTAVVSSTKNSTMRRAVVATWAGVAALAGADQAHPQSHTYTVLIRQIDGVESIPAHMTCEDGRICRGEMSVSIEGGHRRVFVRGMIDGPYAYFKFRSDTQTLHCGDVEFITFQIGPPPVSAHDEHGICDRPSAALNDPSGLRHPVLTNFPPFAILRIDVTSREASPR
jgi:hypothetical protein